MFNRTYYHGITRKLIVGMGNLFSGIKIERRNSDNVVEQLIDVPVAYGNREKWLQRLNEEPTFDKRVLITLPRIGFEMVGIEYDPSRKLNKATQLRSCGGTGELGSALTAAAPVPYNVNFVVYVMTKTQDDALQIVEQILPYFSPQYTITINLVPEMGIVQDIPINLNGVEISDTYEGAMESRREIVYTLAFTAKAEFLGPTKQSTNVILHTKVKLDPMSGQTGREVDTDVVGTIEDYQIVDSFFDIARPISPTSPTFI